MRNSPGRQRDQRGEGRFGLLIAIVVVAAIIYFLVKLVPPRIERAEFQEFVEVSAREMIVQNKSHESLMEVILTEAGKMGLPVKEEAIRISETEQRIVVDLDYDKVISLIGGKEMVQRMEVHADVPKL